MTIAVGVDDGCDDDSFFLSQQTSEQPKNVDLKFGCVVLLVKNKTHVHLYTGEYHPNSGVSSFPIYLSIQLPPVWK